MSQAGLPALIILFAVLLAALLAWCVVGSCLGPPIAAAFRSWWENAIVTAEINTQGRRRRRDWDESPGDMDSWEMERLGHGIR